MSLRKSNSESFGLGMHRSPWRRTRSNPVPAQSTSRPLVPVSAATKSKLNQFQFHAPLHDVETQKENTTIIDDVADDGYDKPHKRSPLGLSKDDTAITPVTMLSWRDFDPQPKPTEDQETNISPTERLLWNNRPDPMYASVLSPILRRRTRKRARSSSPTSSPSNDVPSTPSVNVKKLTEAFRSPHTDPTTALWDRYSTMGGSNAPIGITNPALAQLMVSSSPRPTKTTTPTGEPSLRRAISYGRNLAKRRRLDRIDPMTEASRISDEVSKTRLVDELLDSVTSSIQDAVVPAVSEDLTTKSPSPRKRRIEPAAEHVLNSHVLQPSSPQHHEPGDPHGPLADTDVQGAEAALSDYGDIDFDEDTLNEIVSGFDGSEANVDDKAAEVQPAAEAIVVNSDSFLSEDFGDLDDETLLDMTEDVMTGPYTRPKLHQSPTKQLPGLEMDLKADEMEDMFGGDDFGGDFDFDAAELAATQSSKNPSQSVLAPSQKPRTIQRYLVTNILESEYVDERGHARLEKILLVQADNSKTVYTVHLRGDWYETPASLKAYVHVIGDFSTCGRCVIDDSQNMVILHPDQLISATVVADSFTCMRRAVLQDRVKATGDATPPLVYGTILHEIFQEAMTENKWDLPSLTKIIDRILEKHVEDLYIIKVSKAIAREHLQSKMIELNYWATAFVSSEPKPNAVVNDRGGKKANMCVGRLLDVEEHVWSPMYGLKGNIDATVQVTMKDGDDERTLTVPFEVKTGRHASENHIAQTALYSLLLSDRYDIEIVYGILYYMETSQTMRIPAIRHELRHMIMQRNRLACYVRERSTQLPPMKRSKNTCNKCYAKTSCFIYHKLADDGDGETSGMAKLFDEHVAHLTPAHKEFFLKWENLLTKEEKDVQKVKRELWTMTSAQREKVGRCFADVVIEEGSVVEETDKPKINRFQYTFFKEDAAPNFSFLESQLAQGEPVVVSDEDGHFALALGYVTKVRRRRITVAVDRRLHNARIRRDGFDESRNQVFASIMDVAPEGATAAQSSGRIRLPPVRYRLDKDEFSNGMAVVRSNLVAVMAEGVGSLGSRDIRRLVVDLAPPRFRTAPTQYAVSGDGGGGSEGEGGLNVDQRRAVEKVMSAVDYALVLGMPGTGKTTTIAHIIRALTGQGKSVLLTSYTHTAVDNILLKLRDDNLPILRLGAPAKVHREVQEFAVLAGRPMSSPEEIRAAWHDTPVVATTCLGIGHPVFRERTFDYCIVDEASQITLPVCLGPIRMAGTFVLVGDHNQLPPLVKNEEAKAGGLDVSLFKLLSDAHPQSVVNLEHQYRMCEDIMMLSSKLIYEGRLRCGTDELRTRKLQLPDMAALAARHHDAQSLQMLQQLQPLSTPRSFCTGVNNAGGCWLRQLLDPEARVRLVNTDTLAPRALEEAKGSRIVNPGEAGVVVRLVEALATAGVAEADIGVMTHYRSQLALLRHALRSRPAVEADTADRFQGRDKEVVVLSLVRSNEARAVGDLLKDWRRVNVALTRAKTKLLVVGSRETLKGCGDDEMLSRFVRLVEEQGWVFDLPPDALTSHHFDEMVTTQSGSPVKSSRSPAKKSVKMSPLPLPLCSPVKIKLGSQERKMVDTEGDHHQDAKKEEGDDEKENRTLRPVKKARMGTACCSRGKSS